MIRTIKNVEKIAIYDNQKTKYSMSNVKKRTGCDDIINGGYFNMSTLKPLTHLKVDGVVKCSDQYKYWGYAFNTNSKTLTLTIDYSEYDNYICGVCMVRDGVKQTMYYNSDVGGKRGRSAIGVMPDGSIVMYCTSDSGSDKKTPEQLQTYFLELGVDSAVMLDSGGSSQGNFNGTTVTSSRVVSNLICIWESDSSSNSTEEGESGSSGSPDSGNSGTGDSGNPNTPLERTPDVPDWTSEDMWDCGYTEPTTLVQSGSTGTGAKWVQAMLQKIGFLLIVDGEIGTESVNAIKSFQKYWSLSSDGQVGSDTRTALKNCIYGITANPKEMVNVATAEICRTESDGKDDKYINWYNAANGTSFATTVAWCAIFVSWCMRRSGIDENIYPSFASCSLGSKVFRDNGVLRDPDEYNPKSGDIIFFDFDKNGAPEHVGMVFSNDGTYVETIEGNSSDAVKHNKYSLDSSSIYAYVEIKYPES